MALDRTVSVKLKAEVAGYMASIKQAGAATTSFAKGIEQGAVKNKAHLDKVGGALLGIGAVAGLGVAAAVKSFADFDQSMSHVAAATHESAANMTLLRDAAIDAGARTAFSATEAAGAEEALAKAGVNTADILKGALNGALDLAAAGTLGVSDAAEIAATAMTQFGLAGTDVPHIADLLAAAAGKAQGEVSDMGVALKYVGPVAHQMGVSIEETSGAIAELASNGILADQAGTSLRGILSSLTSPSKAAADAMKQYGIDVYDVAGNFVGFSGVAGQLHDKLGKLDNATRDAALGQLFGNQQITAARILYAGGAQDVQKWTKNVNDAGYAQETAAIKMDNLKGDIEKLRGSLSTLLITTGAASDGFLRGATQGAERFVNMLSDLPKPAHDAALGFGAVVTAVGLIGGGGIKAVQSLASMKTALAALKTSAVGAGLAVGGATLAFAAIAAPIVIMANEHAKAVGRVKDLTAAILEDNGVIAEHTRVTTIAALSEGGLLEAADKLGISASTLTDAFMGNATAQAEVNRLTSESAGGFSQLGNKAQALNPFLSDTADASTKITTAMKDNNQELPKALQNAKLQADAMGDLASKTGDAAGETSTWKDATVHAIDPAKDLRTQQEAMATAAQEQAASLKDAVDAMELLNGINIGTIESEANFVKSLRQAKKAIDDHGKSMEAGTAAGDANRQMLIDLAKEAETNAKAVGQAGGDVDKTMKTNIARIKERADALGLDKKAVADLINQIIIIPPVAKTVFKVPGLADAVDQSKLYQDHLRSLPNDKRTKITAPGLAGAVAAAKDLDYWLHHLPREVQTTIRQNVVTHHNERYKNGDPGVAASGGFITGPGGPRTDSVPMWLSNGEYVINAAATAANRTLLDTINKGGLTKGATTTRTPSGYANGGSVRASGSTLTLEQHVTVANLDDLNRKTQHSMRDLATMANLRGM